jgi:hypothetical protein
MVLKTLNKIIFDIENEFNYLKNSKNPSYDNLYYKIKIASYFYKDIEKNDKIKTILSKISAPKDVVKIDYGFVFNLDFNKIKNKSCDTDYIIQKYNDDLAYQFNNLNESDIQEKNNLSSKFVLHNFMNYSDIHKDILKFKNEVHLIKPLDIKAILVNNKNLNSNKLFIEKIKNDISKNLSIYNILFFNFKKSLSKIKSKFKKNTRGMYGFESKMILNKKKV